MERSQPFLKKIADHFCQHFANNLSENNNIGNQINYFGRDINQTLFLSKASDMEVHCTIMNLKNSNSHQTNDMPLYIWKSIADLIATPVSTYINNSFQNGSYPKILKTA